MNICEEETTDDYMSLKYECIDVWVSEEYGCDTTSRKMEIFCIYEKISL